MTFETWVKCEAHDKLEEIRVLAVKHSDSPAYYKIFELVQEAFLAGREPEDCELYNDCSDCPSDYCCERDGKKELL